MKDTGIYLHHMRAAAPLVHNITNYVAMNIMANVLLAAGASPAMVHAREEVAEFAALAQALSVNIGTLDPAWADAMQMAAQVMIAHGRPWVLDPVGVGATRFRQDVCAGLLDLRPRVIRGNASEILSLAGIIATGRGADAARHGLGLRAERGDRRVCGKPTCLARDSGGNGILRVGGGTCSARRAGARRFSGGVSGRALRPIAR